MYTCISLLVAESDCVTILQASELRSGNRGILPGSTTVITRSAVIASPLCMSQGASRIRGESL